MKLPRNIKRSVRSKNKWKRGESGKSNPEVRTHRDAAKTGGFLTPLAPPGSKTLTVKALEKLNIQNASLPVSKSMEEMSEAETFRSWATNMTNCSNPIFNRVLDPWAGNSAQQREVLAVLSGVTQTIQEKGGKESITEYFAALMLCLETIEEEETLSAVIYLLNLVVSQGVPEPVMRKAFGSAAKHLLSALERFSQDEKHSVCIKLLLNCLGHLLRAQDAEAWSYSSTHQVYRCLLHFITHDKPVIRKTAHQSLCMILKGGILLTSDDPNMVHPASSMTQRHVCDILHTELGTANVPHSTLKSASLKQAGRDTSSLNRVLYVLNFLTGALPVFPVKCVKVTCEELLQLMRLPNLRIHCHVLAVFNELFSSHPNVKTLSLDLTGQMCTALFTHRPGVNEAESNSAWLSALLSGVLHLVQFNADVDNNQQSQLGMQVAEKHLNKLTSEIVALLRSENEAVRSTAIGFAKRILSDVLPDILDRMSRDVVHNLFHTITATLSYQYFEVWHHTLPLISAFIRVWGESGADSILPVMRQLADLRDANKLNLRDDIDHVFAVSIEVLGPEKLLTAVPLNIEEELANRWQFHRSWLLPLVASHVKCTTASYFHSSLLPLADKVHCAAVTLREDGRLTEAAICDALYSQIWSTLPGFCTQPTDWEALRSSDGLLFEMGSRLDSDDSITIKAFILTALRNLLNDCTTQDDGVPATVMKLYAKIFIPKLLTLYETSENESDPVQARQKISNTLNAYFKLVNKKMLQTACIKALTKAMDTKKLIYFDMLSLMAAHLHSAMISQVWSVLSPLLKTEDHHQQKKCYRFLEEICKSDRDGCESFISDNWELLWNSLSDAKTSLKSPVKKARLRCLYSLLKKMNSPNKTFLDSILPEALNSLLDRNSKARLVAGNLLVEITLAIARWRLPDDPFDKEILGESLSTLLDRLWPLLEPVENSDNPLAEVTTLAVAYLFRSKQLVTAITAEHAIQAVEGVERLVSCDSRSLAVKGLQLLRLLVRYTGKLIELDQLLAPLMRVNPDLQRSIRFHIKAIFNKLIPKYGLNTLRDSLPNIYHKQLRNSHSKYARTLKKSGNSEPSGSQEENEHDEEEDGTTMFTSSHLHTAEMDEVLRDSSSDNDDEIDNNARSMTSRRSTVKSQRKVKRKAMQKKNDDGWLEEAPGEILDLTNAVEVSKRLHSGRANLDNNVSKKLGEKRKRDDAFPMKGGKLLITEDGDNDGHQDASSEDEGSNDNDDGEGSPLDDSDCDGPPDSKKYRPGGSGIHRKTTAPQYNLGESYKSQRAVGDMKKRGRPDPFAYLPLNRMPKSGSGHRKLLKTVHKGVAKGRKAAAIAAKQERKRKGRK